MQLHTDQIATYVTGPRTESLESARRRIRKLEHGSTLLFPRVEKASKDQKSGEHVIIAMPASFGSGPATAYRTLSLLEIAAANP
ncbi:MAG: hypothetical protein DCO97_06360 [Marivita sp. XM-24bin2]|nr:MAG: hypothetical protein DCO97_06360 [Marivita sp. XM-24bin2]